MNGDDDGFWDIFVQLMLPWIILGAIIGAAAIFLLGGWQ